MNRPANLRLKCPLNAALLTATLMVSGSVASAIADGTDSPIDSPIYAFGDVHGAYQPLLELLEALALIDGNGRWTGGHSTLVSLGDLLDRGADSRKVLDLLMRLETEAAAAGGAVILVPGNHETMNLSGDLRYVAAAEFAAFGAEEPASLRDQARQQYTAAGPSGEQPEASFARNFPPGFFGHRAAFASTGHYGRWLVEKPPLLVIGRTAFMHGGLPAWLEEMTLTEHNDRFRDQLGTVLRLGAELVTADVLPPWQDLLTAIPLTQDHAELPRFEAARQSRLFGDDGVQWFRGNANCHRLIEQSRLAATLDHLGVVRVVLGHTPTRTRRIEQRFDSRVILADTGMLQQYYKGIPSAVRIEAAAVTGLQLVNGVLETHSAIAESSLDGRIDRRQQLQDALLEIPYEALEPHPSAAGRLMSFDGRSLRLIVLEGSRRERNNALAAYLLDELIGLGFTPVVVSRPESDRRTLAAYPATSVTETERFTQSLYRPNPCGGSGDYQLMYAWDMLVGKDVRSGDQIHYDRQDWTMRLDGHADAFRTSVELPSYLADRPHILPAGLAGRLAELGLAELQEKLGAVLSARQIRALDERRRILLEHWRIE